MRGKAMIRIGWALSGLFILFMWGGAIATQIRVGSPLLNPTLFSIYLALFMWGGLWLRSPALRAVSPLKTKD